MHKRMLWFLLIASLYSAAGMWPFALANSNVERNPAFTASFAAGEKAFAQGNYLLAVNGYQAALVVSPAHLRTLFRLGQSFAALGRHQDAYGQFQRILQQQPANVASRIELAKCLLKNGDDAEARTHLEWVLRVQPNFPGVREMMSALKPQPAKTQVAAKTRIPVKTESASCDGFIPIGAAAKPEAKPRVLQAQAPASFQPWESSAKPKKVDKIKAIPEAECNIQGWRVSDFLAQASGSLGISVEYGKYCIEKGDLKKAHEMLNLAEELAEKAPEQGRMLEIQVHKALLSLYEADIRSFGQTLMRLKPTLSKETLANFLDVYNKAQTAKNPLDVARIVGGVALGAEHFAVAAKILGEVIANSPDDVFALRLLGQAHLENRDFPAAEKAFLRLAALQPKDPEANFNLARFYLTGRFDLVKARAYAEVSCQLNPADKRSRIMLAAIDYFEGRDQEAVTILRTAMTDMKEPSLRMIAQRILDDCNNQKRDPEQARQEFASELALPGSERSPRVGMSRLGEDFLRRGSFFTALKCFLESRNLAEIGRVYLALASNLATAGDERGAAVTAGFGMNALNAELSKNPDSSRAHLYLALYHLERKDRISSRRHIEAGLRNPNSPETERQLLALRKQTS